MTADLTEIPGQAVQSPADLNALLLSVSDGSILFVDETHELEREYQDGT
jgi:Holliday junction resolvasome RuvABC ATP-dependent DNA helicase subunit